MLWGPQQALYTMHLALTMLLPVSTAEFARLLPNFGIRLTAKLFKPNPVNIAVRLMGITFLATLRCTAK